MPGDWQEVSAGPPREAMPRAADLPDVSAAKEFDRQSPLELALAQMKKGVSQKLAAKQAGVSAERLRRYQRLNTKSRKVGRAWEIN